MGTVETSNTNGKANMNTANNLPTFVQSRVDQAIRVGLLSRDSKRINVMAAISSPAADQHIDAALAYLKVAA
jgi:hypothetical protein